MDRRGTVPVGIEDHVIGPPDVSERTTTIPEHGECNGAIDAGASGELRRRHRPIAPAWFTPRARQPRISTL